MKPKDYECKTSTTGYLISSVVEASICGIQNKGRLTIKIARNDTVKISYKDAKGSSTTLAAKSWNSVKAEYLEKYHCIVGVVTVYELSGGGKKVDRPFLIMLDRSAAKKTKNRRIHVYVGRGGGGTPDDGSYTGDDR